MALSETSVERIVTLYDGGKGESVPALAKRFGVSPAAIRYQLKQAGAWPTKGPDPVSEESPTDEELGIGVEDEAPEADALTAMLANPAFAALIDAAVTARMAQMGAPAAPASSEAFQAFTQSIKHLIDTQAMQQPGYIKPLPSDEIDRRLAGKVEMDALLRRYEQAGTPPLWTVGEQGFFECTNALEFVEGEQIRTYLPPVEDFIPGNDEARQVHTAMMQWIGGPTPGIGEQVEAAMIAAKQAPLVSNIMTTETRKSPVELITQRAAPGVRADAPEKASAKRRSAGTIVPERRDISMAERVGAPAGPVFVSADA